ncbi:MAG: fibronectin-binding domain-containing protein [candidate division Zixibacteria bacterium]|nr:fibronectin-binding domain-containing protein [candidate division Zixibacteria bacterium]
MLSSLDITRILAESSRHLEGGLLSAIEYYRKERALQLYVKREKRYCLTMSFHPQRNGFFILPAGRSRLETTEKPRPFAKEMIDSTVTSIQQYPNDRIVEMEVTSGKHRAYLVFEFLGPNGNVWGLDEKKHIVASLRDKAFTAGQPYQPAALPEKLDPLGITVDDLKCLFENAPEINPARLLEKGMYGFGYDLARSLTGDISAAGELTAPEALSRVHDGIQAIVAAYRSTDRPIYVYRLKGKPAFFPVKLAGIEPVGKFATLSEAQWETHDAVRETVETDNLQEKTLKAVDARLKRLQRLLVNLDNDIARAADYERYRQFADLLKIHMSKLRRGMESIDLDDLYHDGAMVTIPLDPALGGSENIEQYSRRYRKGKEGLALLERRRANTRQELESLEEVRALFEGDFETASKRYPEYVHTTVSTPAGSPAVRRPYREYRTSTGLTVFVGKTGGDNDRTTFEYARPYDLWFHTSQCPGSHVVLKVPHKTFEPSKREIEEVAAITAFFSKARGAAKVPVSYTLKKYVRKPRGGKPGLVLIEHEKTIMVAPQEPAKKTDSSDGDDWAAQPVARQ